MTPEREAEIRRLSESWVGDFALRDTLAALDELRVELEAVKRVDMETIRGQAKMLDDLRHTIREMAEVMRADSRT
jgi:hypothetical protein